MKFGTEMQNPFRAHDLTTGLKAQILTTIKASDLSYRDRSSRFRSYSFGARDFSSVQKCSKLIKLFSMFKCYLELSASYPSTPS